MQTFFESPAFQEAVARLDYALTRSHRVAILSGKLGVGKSTLLAHWGERLARQGKLVSYLPTPGTFEQDFLWDLAVGLGADVDLGASPAALWFQLREQLTSHRLNERQVVLLVDHAEEMVPETADVLTTLSRLHGGEENAICLVFAVDSDGLRSLDRRLFNLAQLKIELEGWDAATVASFVESLGSEEAADQAAWDEQAIAALAASCEGSPRVLAQILELSELARKADPEAAPSADLIESLRDELL